MTLQEGTTDAAQSPTDTTTPTATDTPVAAGTPVVDVDLKELLDAHAAAKAEEAGKGTQEGQQEAGTEAQTPTDPKPQDPPAAGKEPMPMIPKARFDEVLSERERLAQETAYWKGVAEGRGPAPAPAAPQPPPITPQQHVNALRLEKASLAKKFDDGEITMSELTAKQDEIDDRIHAVREEALVSKVGNRPQPQTDDFGLQSETAKLEESHPWVKVLEAIPNNDADWDYLRGVAISNLASRGIDATSGKFGTYQLRKEIAELADHYGPTLFGPRAQAHGIALPGTQQPQPKMSPAAQARQAKLDTMSNAPPNVPAMNGAPGTGTGQPSTGQLETMSDEDIGKLPDAVRRKLLGIT